VFVLTVEVARKWMVRGRSFGYVFAGMRETLSVSSEAKMIRNVRGRHG
jgi:hypothetical protein